MKNTMLLLIICSLFACSKNKEASNLDVFILDVKQEQTIRLSEIADNCKIIRLEKNDSCLISNIKKIKKYKNHYLISDAIFQGVYVFDKEGNYINRLDQQGKAPGEYVQLKDFIVDTTLKRIEVLDMIKKKILYYDIETFNFIGEIEVPVKFCATFIKNKKGYFFQTNGTIYKAKGEKKGNYEVDFFNEKMADVKHLIKGQETDDNRYIQFLNIFTESSKDKYISLAWNDTIFRLEGENPRPFLKVNYYDYHIPERIKNATYDEKIKYIKSDQVKGKISFVKLMMNEGDDMIFTYSKLPTSDSGHFFSFDNGKKIICTDCIINDITEYPKEIKNIAQFDNREMLSIYYPGNYADDPEFLENLGVSENDNPILIISHL